MTKSAMIRARIDPALKDEVESIFQELGLSTTQALTLFYQQIRLHQGLPFAVRVPPGQSSSGGGSAGFAVDPNRAEMGRNLAAYQAMHSQLVEKYLGQYVAFYKEQLVDFDADAVALLQRVRAEYPGEVVLRRKVESVAEPVLRFRRPRLEGLA